MKETAKVPKAKNKKVSAYQVKETSQLATSTYREDSSCDYWHPLECAEYESERSVHIRRPVVGPFT